MYVPFTKPRILKCPHPHFPYPHILGLFLLSFLILDFFLRNHSMSCEQLTDRIISGLEAQSTDEKRRCWRLFLRALSSNVSFVPKRSRSFSHLHQEQEVSPQSHRLWTEMSYVIVKGLRLGSPSLISNFRPTKGCSEQVIAAAFPSGVEKST